MFKKAILLVHGFAGGNYDYGDLCNNLEFYKDFDVFTFTLPGHDKTIIKHVTEDEWITKAERQIEKIIDHGYKKIYVIGHSMGGVIASHLARKYDEVKKLVLAAPAFKYFSYKDDKLDIIDSLKIIPKLLKDYSTEEVLSRILKVPLSTIKQFTELVDKYADDVKYIKCPTLILRGEKDEIVPFEAVEHAYNNLQSESITVVKLADLNHNLFINDRYEIVERIIISFLRHSNKQKKEIKII